MKKVILFIMVLVVVLPASGQEEEQSILGMRMLLNLLFPGFGLGSFLQGDGIGGTIQLTTQLVAFSLFCCWELLDIPSGEFEVIVGSGFLFLGSRVWGFFRPGFYASAEAQRNRVTFGLFPAVQPCAYRQGFDVGLGLTVRCAIE